MRKLTALALPIALILVPSVSRADTTPVVTKFSVGSMPIALALDTNSKKLYVADAGDNTVRVLDEATGKISKVSGYESMPGSMTIDEMTQKIYVANQMENTVSVIDETSNSVVATIDSKVKPIGTTDLTGIALDPARHIMYLADFPEGKLLVFDTLKNSRIKSVALKTGVSAVAVDLTANFVYVTNVLDGTLTQISSSSLKVNSTVKVGKSPSALAVGSDSRVYVVNNESNNVSVFDIRKRGVTGTIAVGKSPVAIVLRPNSQEIYVANFDGSSISVMSSTSWKLVRTLKGATQARSLVCDTQENTIFAALMGAGKVWKIGN